MKSAPEPWRVWQCGLGVIACLLVPAWSWLDGSGSLAWSMYAHSSSFRLRIVSFDRAGKQRSLAPSALAAHAEQDLRTALGGAEAFRHARQGQLLRRYLPELAQLACDVSRAERVVLTLENKRDLDGPSLVSVERRQCGAQQAEP
ncbi:MAG TPA: hypothetical protein VNG33_05005 [Polyangiaceae bacterium]|nr:hypothetical protein [Polyangiaceae bacterium]